MFGTRTTEDVFRDLVVDLDVVNAQVQSGYSPGVLQKKKKKKTAMETNSRGGQPRSHFDNSPIPVLVGHPTSPAQALAQKAQGNRPGVLRGHIGDQ